MLDWHGNSALSWRTSPSLDISSQVRLTEVSPFFYTNHCCFIITSNYYSFFRSIFLLESILNANTTNSLNPTWSDLSAPGGGGGIWSTLNLAWDGNSWLHLEGTLSWSECNGTMWPTFDYQMQIKTKQRCPYP